MSARDTATGGEQLSRGEELGPLGWSPARLQNVYRSRQMVFWPCLGTNAPFVKHTRNRLSQSSLLLFRGAGVIGQVVLHLALSA
jgi:hypothetical protein